MHVLPRSGDRPPTSTSATRRRSTGTSKATLRARTIGAGRLLRCARRARTRCVAIASAHRRADREARRPKVTSIHPFSSCASYNTHFFDTLRARTSHVNRPRVIRSLSGQHGHCVACLSSLELHYKYRRQLLLKCVPEAVKYKMIFSLNAKTFNSVQTLLLAIYRRRIIVPPCPSKPEHNSALTRSCRR